MKKLILASLLACLALSANACFYNGRSCDRYCDWDDDYYYDDDYNWDDDWDDDDDWEDNSNFTKEDWNNYWTGMFYVSCYSTGICNLMCSATSSCWFDKDGLWGEDSICNYDETTFTWDCPPNIWPEINGDRGTSEGLNTDIDWTKCNWQKDCSETGACKWYSDICAPNQVCMNGKCALDDTNTGDNNTGDNNTDTPVEPTPECTQNSECADNEICTDGRCIPCQSDVCDTTQEVECVFASQCESGLCVDGTCLAPGACVIDANCEEGLSCIEGTCMVRPECLSDDECGEGRICNAENKCEDDVECRKDSDCGEGLLCIQNMCAQCRLNCECPNEGDICMNGTCIAG